MFPLSHNYVPTFILSPQIVTHTDLAPITPVQEYPISGIQFEEHPILLLLSHCSPTYNLLLPHAIFYTVQA